MADGLDYSKEDLTPGFYQTDKQHGAVGGPRLRGRKSGRVAPRDHRMQPAWEDTLQRHDLLPMHDNQVGRNSTFDANQGQLFNTQTVTPRDSRSDVEIAKSRGAVTGDVSVGGKPGAPGMLAAPGFMPTLTRKQKIAAIQNVGKAGKSFAGMMEDRHNVGKNAAEQQWYMGKDDVTGHRTRHVQGDAPRAIQESAARTGTGSGDMIRSVAMTSPQMGWKSEGGFGGPHALSTDKYASTAGTMPNLAAAENVSREVNKLHARTGGEPTADQIDETGRKAANAPRQTVVHRGTMRSGEPFEDVHEVRTGGEAIPEMAVKAAKHLSNAKQTGRGLGAYSIVAPLSQKAPNFEGSLNLSHIDPAVQRIAAQSYTVDRHDVAIVGMDADSPEFKRRGMIEAVAMTGRRDALKARQLPPNRQSDLWEGHRQAKGLGGGNQIFVGGTTTIRSDLDQTSGQSRVQKRSKRAEDLDLEF